jgi:cobalt-zinc-cadmium efflux system outer membrane protein
MVAAMLAGCQSYRSQPLDLLAHREVWLVRSAADESVAAFARRLAAGAAPGEQPPFDLADGLSASEGAVVALVFNPDLRMARLRAGVALASAEHAGLWDDPEFGLEVERIIESVPEPWTLAASVGFTLPVSGRLAVEEDRAEAAHAAELRQVAAEEWSAPIAVRSAWLGWSAQRQRVELLRQLLEQFEPLLSIADQLVASGELSRAEGRLLRIERATRVSDLRIAEMEAGEMELELKAMMGLAPSAPALLMPEPLAVLEPAVEGELHEALAARNPALAVLRAEYEVAEQALRLEIRRQYPDIVVGPGAGVEDGEERLLLGLALPIPLWNRNQRGVAIATAERALAGAAVETELERLSARLAMARLQRGLAEARRLALENEIVPMVEEQDAEARRVAELGEVDTFLLLENLTRLHETKSALIDARLAEARAALGIVELVGPPARAAAAPDPAIPADPPAAAEGATP